MNEVMTEFYLFFPLHTYAKETENCAPIQLEAKPYLRSLRISVRLQVPTQ